MLIQLINLKIQNINVFDIMQKIIKFILPSILCVTEFEAQNIGIFLLEFLKVVSYWQDEKVWEEVKYIINLRNVLQILVFREILTLLLLLS